MRRRAYYTPESPTEGACLRYIMNLGAVFKIYHEPVSPNERGVFKICDGPESPNDAGAFKTYDDWNRQRGRV